MVNVPFAVAALLLGIRYVPESRDPRPGSFDLPGAALSTAGFSLLVYAIIEAPGQGWTSGLIVGLLAASVVLLGAFLWWERRIDEPMLDLGFFRSAGFSVGTAAVSVAFFGLLGGIFALTQYLQFVHGYSAIEAGAIMSPLALGLMMGAGSSSKAAERLGVSRVVAVGLIGLAVMLALTTLWEPQTGAVTLALWFFGLALAMGWVMAPATRRGRGRGARSQVGHRLRHQHRRPHGLGSPRRRRHRLARQLPLLERHGRLARRAARPGAGRRRGVGRRGQCDRRATPRRRRLQLARHGR